MANDKRNVPKPLIPDPMVLLNCRIPKSLKVRVMEVAREQDRVFQRVVATAIREYLQRQGIR